MLSKIIEPLVQGNWIYEPGAEVVSANMMETISSEVDADRLLDSLENDLTYRRYKDRCEYLINNRIKQARSLINQAVNLPEQTGDVSLAFRGSFGRGDPNALSDIDLTVIKRDEYDIENQLQEILRDKISERTFSFSTYPTNPGDYLKKSLAFWLSLPHLRYVAGNVYVQNELRKTSMELLKRMPLDVLLKMYALDCNDRERLNPYSPHSASFKHGIGGIIEYEFIVLIMTWQRLVFGFLSQEQKTHYSFVIRHYRYTALLKEYIRDICIEPIESRLENNDNRPENYPFWFFSYPCANLLALSCHNHAMQLISLIPIDSDYFNPNRTSDDK